jgi:hypothetical protein
MRNPHLAYIFLRRIIAKNGGFYLYSRENIAIYKKTARDKV